MYHSLSLSLALFAFLSAASDSISSCYSVRRQASAMAASDEGFTVSIIGISLQPLELQVTGSMKEADVLAAISPSVNLDTSLYRLLYFGRYVKPHWYMRMVIDEGAHLHVVPKRFVLHANFRDQQFEVECNVDDTIDSLKARVKDLTRCAGEIDLTLIWLGSRTKPMRLNKGKIEDYHITGYNTQLLALEIGCLSKLSVPALEQVASLFGFRGKTRQEKKYEYSMAVSSMMASVLEGMEGKGKGKGKDVYTDAGKGSADAVPGSSGDRGRSSDDGDERRDGSDGGGGDGGDNDSEPDDSGVEV